MEWPWHAVGGLGPREESAAALEPGRTKEVGGGTVPASCAATGSPDYPEDDHQDLECALAPLLPFEVLPTREARVLVSAALGTAVRAERTHHGRREQPSVQELARHTRPSG